MTAPDQPLALADHLCFALYSASMAINRAYKPVLDSLDLTYPQYVVLLTLWEKDEQTIGSIAEKLSLDPSTVTPLMKRLEAGGLVTRQRNPDNERQVIVRLTKAGREMQARSFCVPETLLEKSGLTIAQLVELNRSVSALRDTVVSAAGSASL